MTLLVIAVLGQTFDLGPLDGEGALVLVDAAAREDPHLDDRTGLTPGGNRSEVSRTSEAFSPKMARSSFSSGVIGDSPFGVTLPTRISPGLDLGAHIDDARLVEVLERFLADIRNIAGDFLLTQLGVAGHHFEFLDMDRGEDVIAHDALGDQDRVLEVVAIPRHEGDEDVAPQRQLSPSWSTDRRR